jgi:hypothetical protein
VPFDDIELLNGHLACAKIYRENLPGLPTVTARDHDYRITLPDSALAK